MEEDILKELSKINNSNNDDFIWILLLLAIIDGGLGKEPTTINIYLGEK